MAEKDLLRTLKSLRVLEVICLLLVACGLFAIVVF